MDGAEAILFAAKEDSPCSGGGAVIMFVGTFISNLAQEVIDGIRRFSGPASRAPPQVSHLRLVASQRHHGGDHYCHLLPRGVGPAAEMDRARPRAREGE